MCDFFETPFFCGATEIELSYANAASIRRHPRRRRDELGLLRAEPRPSAGLGRRVTLEICVDSLDLALAAVRGGADRIELCGPLYGGGITPSAGLARAARGAIDLPLAMLVRPRTGPFTVSEAEFEVMRQDVLFAREIGMDIAVLGILREDRTVDVERTRELVERALPMQVTFHRAFDATADQEQALADVISTGANRILSSGARANALLGAPAVARLRAAADGQVDLILCGSIGASTIRQAVTLSGVREIHAALRNSVRASQLNGMMRAGDLDHFAEAVAKLKSRMREGEVAAAEAESKAR